MSVIFIIVGVVFVLSLAFPAGMLLRNYLRYRGKRVITCPETGCPAAVELDAVRAAKTSTFKDAELRLTSCSRWPEREGCGQECVPQIEASPNGCLVRAMVANWYRGTTCAFCGKEIPELHHDHKPALLTPDGKTIEWTAVEPERLPRVLSSHLPVCWNCHVAQTFRKQFPERVIDLPTGRTSSARERTAGDLRPS